MALDSTSASWTSAQLLSDVRRKAQIPATSTDYTDTVLLRESSDVIWSLAGWALQQAGDGRLTFSFDRSVVAAVSGPYRAASEFLLPPQAVGDTIINVVWVDGSGQREHRLALIDVAEQSLYDQANSQGDPRAYALLDGRIRVYPQPTTGGVVRFNYQRRHPELCADTTSNAPAVASVSDAGSGYSTFVLGSSSTFAIGDYVDLVNSQYPYRVVFADLYVGASSGSNATLYVPYSYVSGLSVAGMRVIRSGQSPFVSLPLELRACLSEKVAGNVLRQIGDMTAAGACEAVSISEMQRFLTIINPRSKGDRRKVVNPFSLVRGRGAPIKRRTREAW